MRVADLFAVAAVVAGVPEDETIAAIRVYPNLDRVEFIGTQGVYRTSLDAEVEERQPQGDSGEPGGDAADRAPTKGK